MEEYKELDVEIVEFGDNDLIVTSCTACFHYNETPLDPDD